MNKEGILYYIQNDKRIKRKKLNVISVFIYSLLKMLFDIVIAIIGLVLFSPFFIIISIAIKLDSKGPILFKQKRTGINGKEFTLYKFRSMRFDNDVHDFTTKDQTTKVGNILRKTSLDELPQFINILKLDMSLIGPRPWICDYYEKMNSIQKNRCNVRPGITGLAQSSGRNNITINDKINYDLEYIKNYSLILDIKIIFKTVKSVLSHKGYDAGKSTIKQELDDLEKTRFLEVIK